MTLYSRDEKILFSYKENFLSQLFIPELTSNFATLGFICSAIFKILLSIDKFWTYAHCKTHWWWWNPPPHPHPMTHTTSKGFIMKGLTHSLPTPWSCVWHGGGMIWLPPLNISVLKGLEGWFFSMMWTVDLKLLLPFQMALFHFGIFKVKLQKRL